MQGFSNFIGAANMALSGVPDRRQLIAESFQTQNAIKELSAEEKEIRRLEISTRIRSIKNTYPDIFPENLDLKKYDFDGIIRIYKIHRRYQLVEEKFNSYMGLRDLFLPIVEMGLGIFLGISLEGFAQQERTRKEWETLCHMMADGDVPPADSLPLDISGLEETPQPTVTMGSVLLVIVAGMVFKIVAAYSSRLAIPTAESGGGIKASPTNNDNISSSQRPSPPKYSNAGQPTSPEKKPSVDDLFNFD